MRKPLIQIVRFLKDKDTPTTSVVLADELNVSPRSIKTYILTVSLLQEKATC